MKPRTEDDVLSRAPLQVKLGAETHEIPLLAVMAQRAWRRRLIEELQPVLDSFNFKIDGKGVAEGLTAALLQFPETLVDLVFAYAPSLAEKKDAILEEATEEQIATAFSAILAVAFPFLPQLAMTTNLLRVMPLTKTMMATNKTAS